MPTQIKGTLYYDTEEAGNILGVGSESVRMYIRAGKLRAYKAGRRYFILDSDLSRMITAGEELGLKERLEQIYSLMQGIKAENRSACFDAYMLEIAEELDKLRKEQKEANSN